MTELLYLGAAVLFIFGLKQLSSPRTARRGNMLASVGICSIAPVGIESVGGRRPSDGGRRQNVKR